MARHLKTLPEDSAGPLFLNALEQLVHAHCAELAKLREDAMYFLPSGEDEPLKPMKSDFMPVVAVSNLHGASADNDFVPIVPMAAVEQNGNRTHYEEPIQEEPAMKSVAKTQLEVDPTWNSNPEQECSVPQICKDDLDEEECYDKDGPPTEYEGDMIGSWRRSFIALHHDAAKTFRGSSKKDDANRCKKFALSSGFEAVFAVVIFLNTITIALETQYRGIDVGNKLGVPGFEKSAEERYASMESIFHVVEVVFCVLFSLELLVKLAGLRCMFFLYAWNVFDLAIMLFWFIQVLVQWNPIGNPTLLRLFRVARVLRVVRLFKSMVAMDSLQILVKSIVASFSTLVWTTGLIAILVTLVSLIVNNVVTDYLQDEANPIEKRHEVFKYFGTFSFCTTSFFEATLGNFAPIMRNMSDNVGERWVAFFMLYKVGAGFAVVTVATGVFMQETFKVASSDDDLLVIRQKRKGQAHASKMHRLFAAADRFDTGVLSYRDFKSLMEDQYVSTWLAAYELSTDDCERLFHLLDNGDGQLTPEELLKGVNRLKGPARSVDLHTTLIEVNDLKSMLKELQETLHRGYSMKKISTDECDRRFTKISPADANGFSSAEVESN